MDTPTSPTVPTLAEVERIATLADPVIRNLQITQCYHELSAVHAGRCSPGANWCTFATWASRQAGQTIRKEDLARTIERLTGSGSLAERAARRLAAVARRFGSRLQADEILKILWELVDPEAVVERISVAVARGNKKVFEEIGWEFARFFAACLNDAAFDAAKIERFCAALRDGDPPEGQGYLRRAFNHYYRALFTADAKERAEFLLMANIEVGFHEQTRLQPEIAAALNAAVIDPTAFAERLIVAIFPHGGLLVAGRRLLMGLAGRPTPLQVAINAFVETVRQELRLIITDHLMTFELPDGVILRLGEDVTGEFPPLLREIANAELRALLACVDPTPNSLCRSGAVDWADFPDRVHFIVDLFRSRHGAPELFDPPYTPEQVADLKAGRIPVGRL
ncbi:hypothetical protein [Geobacter sp.]|uniref:hypothetical protein n=1 Tax=Geobacter sp. TaxID=46610 RepID=UPI0027B89A0B|nr:hypothetical protein [Geobacter sp.]